jgi:hypothetical protein
MSFKAQAWAIEQQDVAGLEKFVLIMLAYRDSHDEPHGCYPSIERIALDCGIGRSTVIEHLNSLEEKGKIKRTRRTDSQGGNTSNFYEFPVWGSDSRRGVVRQSEGGSPTVGHKPAVEPEVNRHLPREVREETSTSSTTPPSKDKENPQESYRVAKRIYRPLCKGNLGNLGESTGEQWNSLVDRHGSECVLAALKIWAQELGVNKLRYPIAVFLKNAEEYIEAVQAEASGSGGEVEEEDGMITIQDIRREREERDRQSRGK